MTISLENDKKFVINAEGNCKENVYIDSAKLNGETYTKNFLRYGDIEKGDEFQLKMSGKPN